jgi:hypothetical protein
MVEFVETPLVQIVLPAGILVNNQDAPVVPFSDLALEGDDPATVSDSDMIARATRWFDLPAGTLAGYQVTRPASGNILVSPKATYG